MAINSGDEPLGPVGSNPGATPIRKGRRSESDASSASSGAKVDEPEIVLTKETVADDRTQRRIDEALGASLEPFVQDLRNKGRIVKKADTGEGDADGS